MRCMESLSHGAQERGQVAISTGIGYPIAIELLVLRSFRLRGRGLKTLSAGTLQQHGVIVRARQLQRKNKTGNLAPLANCSSGTLKWWSALITPGFGPFTSKLPSGMNSGFSPHPTPKPGYYFQNLLPLRSAPQQGSSIHTHTATQI